MEVDERTYSTGSLGSLFGDRNVSTGSGTGRASASEAALAAMFGTETLDLGTSPLTSQTMSEVLGAPAGNAGWGFLDDGLIDPATLQMDSALVAKPEPTLAPASLTPGGGDSVLATTEVETPTRRPRSARTAAREAVAAAAAAAGAEDTNMYAAPAPPAAAPKAKARAKAKPKSKRRRSHTAGRPSTCPNPTHSEGCTDGPHCKCPAFPPFCHHGPGECVSTQNVKWRKFCNACLAGKRNSKKQGLIPDKPSKKRPLPSAGRPSTCPNPEHSAGCTDGPHCKCPAFTRCKHGPGGCESTQNVKWRKFCNSCLASKRHDKRLSDSASPMSASPLTPNSPAAAARAARGRQPPAKRQRTAQSYLPTLPTAPPTRDYYQQQQHHNPAAYSGAYAAAVGAPTTMQQRWDTMEAPAGAGLGNGAITNPAYVGDPLAYDVVMAGDERPPWYSPSSEASDGTDLSVEELQDIILAGLGDVPVKSEHVKVELDSGPVGQHRNALDQLDFVWAGKEEGEEGKAGAASGAGEGEEEEEEEAGQVEQAAAAEGEADKGGRSTSTGSGSSGREDPTTRSARVESAVSTSFIPESSAVVGSRAVSTDSSNPPARQRVPSVHVNAGAAGQRLFPPANAEAALGAKGADAAADPSVPAVVSAVVAAAHPPPGKELSKSDKLALIHETVQRRPSADAAAGPPPSPAGYSAPDAAKAAHTAVAMGLPAEKSSYIHTSDSTVSMSTLPPAPRSLLVAYLLWPLGFLGAHQFYMRRRAMGMVYMCTLGLLGIGWLSDLYRMPGLLRRANLSHRERHEDTEENRELHVTDTRFITIGGGFFGLHHFYMRRFAWGVLYLFTAGLLGLGWLADIFRTRSIVTKAYKEQSGKPEFSIGDCRILAVFLGFTGAHHLYLKQYRWALLYLCTLGLFGVGWWVDVCRCDHLVGAAYAGRSSRPRPRTGHSAEHVLTDEVVNTRLLAGTLGFVGAHHYYNKRYGWGVLYTCTAGLFTIGWIYDTIRARDLVLSSRTLQMSGSRKYTKQNTLLLAATPLGMLGAHHYYLRRWGWGVLYTLTLGLLGVGWISDCFRMEGIVKRMNRRENRRYSKHREFDVGDARLLAGPFGFLGLHHFYMQRYDKGALYVCTLGLLGVGWISDIFRMQTIVDQESARHSQRRLGNSLDNSLVDNAQPVTAQPHAGEGPQRLCTICMDEVVNTVVLPCAHSVMCMTCGEAVQRGSHPSCPICRKKVVHVQRLYYA